MILIYINENLGYLERNKGGWLNLADWNESLVLILRCQGQINYLVDGGGDIVDCYIVVEF